MYAESPDKKLVMILKLQVVIANLLASHRTTVTIVTRLPPPPPRSGDAAADDVGVAESDTQEEAWPEWEALRLHLSRDDLSRGTELESFIVRDLAIRHQNHISKN